MHKLYIPITSEQFDQLYRFGEIYLPQYISVDGAESFDSIQNKLVQVFQTYLPFIYDETYLVLEVATRVGETQGRCYFKTTDVQKVYPLSREGGEALALKKNHQVSFSPPIFTEQHFRDINNNFYAKEAQDGYTCLYQLFYQQLDNFSLEHFKLDEVEKAAISFRNHHKIEQLSAEEPWVTFAFTYIYQAYYPLTTLGYFYRTAEILTRKALREKGHNYNPAILEKTSIYQLLNKLAAQDIGTMSLKAIVAQLQNDTDGNKFITNLTQNGIKYYVVIPMFLKLIDEFNEKHSLEQAQLERYIFSYKEAFPLECQLLLIWIGAYLGFGNCYDYYYTRSNLKFFKNYIPIAVPSVENIETKSETEVKEDTENRKTLEDEVLTPVAVESEANVNEKTLTHEQEVLLQGVKVTEVLNEELIENKTEHIENHDDENKIVTISSHSTSEGKVNFVNKSISAHEFVLIVKELLNNKNKLKLDELTDYIKTSGIELIEGKKINKTSIKQLIKILECFDVSGKSKSEVVEVKSCNPIDFP